MKANQDLNRALEDWEQGRATLDAVRFLAADLGNRHHVAAIPALIRLLNHEDAIVRYNAVNSLAFELHHKPAAGKLITMLAQDPDDDCRRVAAAALGNLFQNSKETNIMTALAEAAINDSDEYVRISAYKALQIVNGLPRSEHLELLRSESLSVDPRHVRSIMEKSSR